jgi:hypothetical protein
MLARSVSAHGFPVSPDGVTAMLKALVQVSMR